MKCIAIILGSVLAVVVAVLVAIGFAIAPIFLIPYPPQPKFGFNGDWRTTDVFGFEERPLHSRLIRINGYRTPKQGSL